LAPTRRATLAILAAVFDVHRMECIASVLDVQANRVDHAIGARNGGLYGALVMCVGGDLFDVVALSPP
jgi:hypothetical protein